MLDLLHGEDLPHLEFGQVALQEALDGFDVAGSHAAEARRGGFGGDLVLGDHSRFGAAGGQGGETGIVQFEPVERAVEVATRADWFGEEDATGVDALVDAFEVAAAGDFFDEDGSEAFLAELLVDAEEVDFGGFEEDAPDVELDGYAKDAGDEFARFGRADADVPCRAPAGRFQCPAQERGRIVEAEHGLVVLDVVKCQKLVDFLQLFISGQVKLAPFESLG